MNIIEPSFEVLTEIDKDKILKTVERVTICVSNAAIRITLIKNAPCVVVRKSVGSVV